MSKHSHACGSLSLGGPPVPQAHYIWGQTTSPQITGIPPDSCWFPTEWCLEILTAELIKWGWLCFDTWEILYTEMIFSGLPYMPPLFSPGRADLTANSPSKSKGKTCGKCRADLIASSPSKSKGKGSLWLSHMPETWFNFIFHLASHRNWGTKMAAVGFFGDTVKSCHADGLSCDFKYKHYGWLVFHCISVPHQLNPFTCQ